jgi:putative hydrolase of the HAD superfamily
VPEVSVVWCDFGGVLTPPITEAFARTVSAVGVPEEPLRAAIETVAAGFGLRALEPLELDLLTEREWGRQVTAALAPAWRPTGDLGRFGRYWHDGRVLNRPLYDRLVALKGRGPRIGLLTNSIREWEPYRRRMLPVPDVFDARVNSYEAGVRKPDPAIYAVAEAALGAAGAGCLLIDDVPANCAAATDRGWHAIHHVTNDATLAALDRLL